MTKKQREIMAVLIDKHFTEWVNTRMRVEHELSKAQTTFCCCGRLATGMHERLCTKFRNKVNAATVQELRHLVEE